MSNVLRTGLRGLGQTLITLGAIVLLFCVYELRITNLITARAQDRLGDSLVRSWAEAARQRVPTPATSAPEHRLSRPLRRCPATPSSDCTRRRWPATATV